MHGPDAEQDVSIATCQVIIVDLCGELNCEGITKRWLAPLPTSKSQIKRVILDVSNFQNCEKKLTRSTVSNLIPSSAPEECVSDYTTGEANCVCPKDMCDDYVR